MERCLEVPECRWQLQSGNAVYFGNIKSRQKSGKPLCKIQSCCIRRFVFALESQLVQVFFPTHPCSDADARDGPGRRAGPAGLVKLSRASELGNVWGGCAGHGAWRGTCSVRPRNARWGRRHASHPLLVCPLEGRQQQIACVRGQGLPGWPRGALRTYFAALWSASNGPGSVPGGGSCEEWSKSHSPAAAGPFPTREYGRKGSAAPDRDIDKQKTAWSNHDR